MGWDWDNDEKDDDEVKDEMKRKIDESENGNGRMMRSVNSELKRRLIEKRVSEK